MLSGHIARKLEWLQHCTVTKALTAFTTISQLKQFHAHITTSGIPTKHLHPVVTAKLLIFSALSTSPDLNYAQKLFNHASHPSLFMFNTMIRAVSRRAEQPIYSLQFYIQMLRSSISPDHFTFPSLIKSCSATSALVLGQQLHSHVLKLGLDFDVFIVNCLIDMYSHCGEMGDAHKVFVEGFDVVDVVSWTTLITGYSGCGNVDMARKFFDSMPVRNGVSWNAMITGYARSGSCIDKARELFDEMSERNERWLGLGIVPNEAALVSAVSACAHLRSLEEGMWLHSLIEERKLKLNVTVGTALVDMYGKCGSIERARVVFDDMPVKNVMTWNSMIAGLALNGYGKQALSLFWRMRIEGALPNAITFIGVLTGCSHSGLVDEGKRAFEVMIQEYQIEPQLEHYGSMVDLLGRAGLVQEALDFVEKMPVEPHPGLWGALVNACRIHGDVKLGEELGKRLVELEPNHCGRYSLLSNIFAAAERWDDLATVRNLVKDRNVVKSPGNSIIKT
ncbi:hypothetical protein Syun_018983 [Stephania yunnanensis]|uniref:Pentatricopeptide repeat-containing protein n=1 Tax=Stephania yunnanensis TaxID=152371 RepID=A0AAP0IVL9_9MAGN